MLPHAYAGIQSHIRQGQLLALSGPRLRGGERSELRARDPHTKQSLRNLASFRQMGLSERYLGPFSGPLDGHFSDATPVARSPFSSMNSEASYRLSQEQQQKIGFAPPIEVSRAAQSICGIFPLAVLRNRTPGPPPVFVDEFRPALLLQHVAVNRLDDKQNGAIVLVMQRLHEDDLAGVLLRGSDEWTVLSLPAIAERDEQISIGNGQFYCRRAGDVLHPEREPRDVLELLRASKCGDLCGPVSAAACGPRWRDDEARLGPPL